MSSHRTSAENDSLFVAAMFSTTPQHVLQANGHRASTSSPNVRLQCHDSLTLFHISQLLSLSTNSNSSPPCLLTDCHCSLPSFNVIVTTTRQRSQSTSSLLQIIDSKQHTTTSSPPLQHRYIIHQLSTGHHHLQHRFI